MVKNKLNYILIACAVSASLCIVVRCIGKVLVLSLLPFAVAWIISLPVKPLSVYLSKKLKLKQNFCAAVLIISICALLFLIIGNLIGILMREAVSLIEEVTEKLDDGEGLLSTVLKKVNALGNFFHSKKANEAATTIYEGIRSLALNALETVSSEIAEFAASFIGKMPGFIFALITSVISLFYICTSQHGGNSEAKSGFTKSIFEIRRCISDAVGKYLRSYLIILLITFAELFLAFVILRIDYALLLSLAVAVIDFLPVLGTGIVIVPWGLACLLTGAARRGIGLLVTWGIMYLVRQLIEPRIVSGVMGIHPLASLFAIYLGYISCGVFGMIIFPILLYIAKALLKSDIQKSLKSV